MLSTIVGTEDGTCADAQRRGIVQYGLAPGDLTSDDLNAAAKRPNSDRPQSGTRYFSKQAVARES
jgi:hypothetical protein